MKSIEVSKTTILLIIKVLNPLFTLLNRAILAFNRRPDIWLPFELSLFSTIEQFTLLDWQNFLPFLTFTLFLLPGAALTHDPILYNKFKDDKEEIKYAHGLSWRGIQINRELIFRKKRNEAGKLIKKVVDVSSDFVSKYTLERMVTDPLKGKWEKRNFSINTLNVIALFLAVPGWNQLVLKLKNGWKPDLAWFDYVIKQWIDSQDIGTVE